MSENSPNKLKGVFLDASSLDIEDINFISLKNVLANWQFYDETLPFQVSERIVDADIIISNKVVLDENIISKASCLKLICVAATGVNNVDIAAAKKRNIAVCNVTAYAVSSVSQHVLLLILALFRRLNDYQNLIRLGAWQKSSQFCLLQYPIEDLTGKTIGIVGYGELGKAVANIAKAFGMKILIAARAGTVVKDGCLPLHELLSKVDVLSLHCPLNEQTRGLIGEAELACMKSSAFLINTARGGIVDEQALVNALLQNDIAGAGVDVLIDEPPVAGNPLLDLDLPNLIISPHIAWGSRAARQRLVDEIAENIEAWKKSVARNIIC